MQAEKFIPNWITLWKRSSAETQPIYPIPDDQEYSPLTPLLLSVLNEEKKIYADLYQAESRDRFGRKIYHLRRLFQIGTASWNIDYVAEQAQSENELSIDVANTTLNDFSILLADKGITASIFLDHNGNLASTHVTIDAQRAPVTKDTKEAFITEVRSCIEQDDTFTLEKLIPKPVPVYRNYSYYDENVEQADFTDQYAAQIEMSLFQIFSPQIASSNKAIKYLVDTLSESLFINYVQGTPRENITATVVIGWLKEYFKNRIVTLAYGASANMPESKLIIEPKSRPGFFPNNFLVSSVIDNTATPLGTLSRNQKLNTGQLELELFQIITSESVAINCIAVKTPTQTSMLKMMHGIDIDTICREIEQGDVPTLEKIGRLFTLSDHLM